MTTTQPRNPDQPPPGGDRVRLIATADTALTELIVHDGRYREVARGRARLRLALPRGVYKVEFRTGDKKVVRYAALTGEQPEVAVSIGPDDLPLSCAAPIQASGEQREQAVRLSHSPPALRDDDAQLLMFIRDPVESDKACGGPEMLAGITLHSLDGTQVANLADRLESGRGWAGVLLELAPAYYRLRTPGASGRRFEQTVAVCPGWQTQLFLACHGPIQDRASSLFDASIYLAPVSRGFDPTRPDIRLVEQARRGLADGQDLLARIRPRSTRGMAHWLELAAKEPMLGLMAIHLLRHRLTPERDDGRLGATVRASIREIARAVRGVLGDLPDLCAIEAWLAPYDDHSACVTPPMLLDSWRAVREASYHRAGVMDPEDLAARITGRIWSPGPWLIWEYDTALDAPPRHPRLQEPIPSELISQAPALVAEALTSRSDDSDPSIIRFVREQHLDRVQAEVLGYFWGMAVSQLARLRRASGTPGRREPHLDSNTPPVADTPVFSAVASDLMAPLSVVGKVLKELMARIAPDRPELRRLLNSPWPPPDGRAFVSSEQFGELLAELVGQFREKYVKMDFSDALAEVFVWFDGKVSREPDFLAKGRFKTAKAFAAYARQAIWNAARLTERKSKGERRESLDLDRDAPPGEDLPEQAAAVSEAIDTLPPLQSTVLRRMLHDPAATAESLAIELHLHIDEIYRIIDDAADAMGAAPHPKKRSKS